MMLVEQDSARRRSLPGIAQNETVGIHFTVPNDAGDQHFRLEGRIVRVMDSGVGIAFPRGMDDDAMTALLNLSNSQPLASRRKRPPSAVAARGTIRASRVSAVTSALDGSASRLVMRALSDRPADPDEIAEIRALLDRLEER